MKAGCKIIEVRLSPTVHYEFEEVETICGDLDDAKQVVSAYMGRHRLHGLGNWVEGDPDENGPVYYANNGRVTFRIRQ